MSDLYRTDPPIDIADLAETEVPFDLAVESLHYYQVHVRPSKWPKMVFFMQDWFHLVGMLRREDLSHTGYDYPDWRQFALIDMSMPTRVHLCTHLRWFDNIEWSESATVIEQNKALLDKKDLVDLMARIRVGLEAKIDHSTLPLYILSLLHCKYRLIHSSVSEHDSLLPIYNSLYSSLLVVFNLHPMIFKTNSFWLVHSILFLFPLEIGKLDVGTFQDRTSWFIYNFGLISAHLELYNG